MAKLHPAVSIAFWSSLAASIALLAAVALAPRWRACRQMQRQYDGLRRELADQERQVESLHGFVDALERDPDHAADFGESAAPAAPGGAHRAIARPEWFEGPLLNALSDDSNLRLSLFGGSAALMVVAFLLPSRARPKRPKKSVVRRPGIVRRNRAAAWIADRYTKRPDDAA